MAYTSGTASHYKELLSILATFAAANGWTILEQSETRIYLRGEGLSGLDEIYAGAEAFENSTAGYYNWRVAGAWGWRAGRAVGAHPMSSQLCYLYLWQTAIPYWMFGHAGRLIVVAKVSSVYQMLYLGFGLPPATSNQYPYPLIIGGCGTSETALYSASGNNNTMFWANNAPTGLICRPGGDWDQIGPANCPPLNVGWRFVSSVQPAVDGSYLLEEIFVTDSNRASIYCALDGIYRVSGFGNSAENIITVGGINYLVVPDVYRSAIENYCAVRMV